MTSDVLRLENRDLTVIVDPGRGADVLSLTHRREQLDVLFCSPWRARADAIRAGQPPSTSDPTAGWLEQYRGGWQTLCPNAGPPRAVHGAPVGFHGEASTVPWRVASAAEDRAKMSVELFAVPVRIERTLRLEGATLRVEDHLRNLSPTPLEIDYSSHPALGGAFLEGECLIRTGARRFTSDPDTESALFVPGSEHDWPFARTRDGDSVDLRLVPGPGVHREVFGWLDDFTEHWASVASVQRGLTVRVAWDGQHLPYAWLWQELNHGETFPWYGRARAIAIEPASTQTSGPGRRSVLRLGPQESIDLWLSVGIEDGRA